MLYAVVDPIVDGYFPVLDRLWATRSTNSRTRWSGTPDQDVVERLFRVRRELLEVRHTVTPEREVFNQLTNREVGLIAADRVDLFPRRLRPPDPHHRRARHATASSSPGRIETYLSTVNNNLSEIMKRLTAVTAILAGVGAVAGIFGMSEAATAFQFQEGGGFWLVTAFCVLWASSSTSSSGDPLDLGGERRVLSGVAGLTPRALRRLRAP